MMVEGILQFLAACAGTIGFSVLFSVPKEHYLRCGWIGGSGWLVCWILVHGFHMGTIEANFLATVYIALASRISSTVEKCPVTLFLISGIIPGGSGYRCIPNYLLQYFGRSSEEYFLWKRNSWNCHCHGSWHYPGI